MLTDLLQKKYIFSELIKLSKQGKSCKNKPYELQFSIKFTHV